MKYITKRNYKIIKSIKYILFIFALIALLIIGYFALINKTNKFSQKDKNHKESLIRFSITEPDLKGISIDNGPYYIKSQQMQEIDNKIFFTDPQVKLMVKHLDWLNLTAKSAALSRTNNKLDLSNNVRADLNDHYHLETEEVEVLIKDSIIKSDKYAKIHSPEYNLVSNNGFNVNYNQQTAFFYGNINSDIINPDDHSVVNIRSEKFDVFWLKKLGIFSGNVVMIKDDVTVKADKMEVLTNKSNNKIEKIYLYNNVEIINGKERATSEYGELILKTSILTLKQKVKLYQQDNVITGETLYYNFKSKQANLIAAENNRVRAIIHPKDSSILQGK